MHGLEFLRDLITIFGVSLVVVLVLHRLRFPTITGFLVSGMLLGPHGFSLISDIGRIEVLAEVGVVMLLFTIGMEFSLATLKRLWGAALLGALVPIAANAALGASAAALLGLPLGSGIYIGFLVGLSSTVIPLKALSDRGQVDSPHGRAATGVAVFQDLLVIPMMLLTPYLAGRMTEAGVSPGWTLVEPLLALGQAFLVIAVVLVVALWLVPRLLTRLTEMDSREVFIIALFFICLGTAWLTSEVGLSLALGAFLAGLVISESEYGHQALADILPFRDSLNSLFFVSIGMLMSPEVVVRMPVQVLAAAAGIIVLKLLMIGGVLLMIGQRPTVALQAGLALAQVGEFSFVLMRFGAGYNLMSDLASQVFLSSAVITMLVTPLILAASPPLLKLVQEWEDRGWWKPARDLRHPETSPASAMEGHVIIVGYGFNGRNLARVLKEIEVPYVVLEMNPTAVREARADGETIVYGDASSLGILDQLGAASARVLVLAISDPASTRRAVALAARRYPGLHIVVRTRYLTEVDDLYRLGAQVVIPEEVETSMEIFAQVVEMFGVPRQALIKHARRIRAERYGVFRMGRAAGRHEGAISPIGPYLASADVKICAITSGSPAAGRSLRELDLRRATGATVLAVMRSGQVAANPAPDTSLNEGDAVVLVGGTEQIATAVEALTGAGGEG